MGLDVKGNRGSGVMIKFKTSGPSKVGRSTLMREDGWCGPGVRGGNSSHGKVRDEWGRRHLNLDLGGPAQAGPSLRSHDEFCGRDDKNSLRGLGGRGRPPYMVRGYL
jgi:hypothetical protein